MDEDQVGNNMDFLRRFYDLVNCDEISVQFVIERLKSDEYDQAFKDKNYDVCVKTTIMAKNGIPFDRVKKILEKYEGK